MMEIACIADRGYARHAATMLRSAIRHTADDAWVVHVLHASPLEAGDQRGIEETLDGFDAEVRFHHVQRHDLSTLPAGFFPHSVWLRIFLPELLINTARVLYLDADVIVVDDLEPLWATDLGGHLLGAVTNPLYPFQPPYAREQLGIEDPADYFNSGVLLMDLDAMRAAGTVDELTSYGRRHPENLYPDQDALNMVIGDRRLHLHPRWNLQNTFFDLSAEDLPFPPAVVEDALTRPAALHFIGPFKPWRYMCRHPLRSLYVAEAAQTTWGVPAFPDRTIKNALLRRLPLSWLDRIDVAERNVARRWPRLGAYLSKRQVVA